MSNPSKIPPVASSVAGPVSGGAQAITASDSTLYDPPLRAIYIGGTGTVVIEHGDNSVATMTNVPVGWLPVSNIYKVKAATTATGIVGWSA